MKKNEIDKWEYRYMHDWLRKTYGKADHCENKECTGENIKRFEYALKHECDYDYNVENYIQLCVRCHRYYDTPGFTGKTHSDKSKAIMRAKKIGSVPINKGKKGLQTAWNKGKKGLCTAWNKGIKTGPQSKEVIENRAKKNTGKTRSEETKQKMRNAWLKRKGLL